MTEDTPERELGVSETALHTTDRTESGHIVLQLVSQARRHVALVAPRFEHPVFMSEALYTALSHLPAAHPRNAIRLLVEDEDFFLAKNTRLTHLCRRFNTYVNAHRIPEHQQPFGELVVVVDDVGYAHQPVIDKPVLNACFNDRARCRQLLRRFDEMWAHSVPVAGLSTLGL